MQVCSRLASALFMLCTPLFDTLSALALLIKIQWSVTGHSIFSAFCILLLSVPFYSAMSFRQDVWKRKTMRIFGYHIWARLRMFSFPVWLKLLKLYATIIKQVTAEWSDTDNRMTLCCISCDLLIHYLHLGCSTLCARHLCLVYLLVHVDGVRLRLWTAVNVGHVVHPLGDIWVRSHGGMMLTGKDQRTQRNMSQCHFVPTISHMYWPGCKPGTVRWEVGN
jgi:hypothetical protein